MGKITAITIHAGHNKSGKVACGASDYLDESHEARVIMRKVRRRLRLNGIKVYNCTVNDGTSRSDVLNKIVTKCNARTRDIDVSIHFNACSHSKSDGKTKGIEVWVKTTTGVRGTLAASICKGIADLGFTNRGVKTTNNLYFLNHTVQPALLIEVCFVDDEDDAKLYKKKRRKVAKAIATAIMNYK